MNTLSKKINAITINSWFTAFVALSVLFQVLMNLVATRAIGWGTFQLTNAGLLLIAPVMVIQNVITELWGKRTAYKVAIFGIAVNLFVVLFLFVANMLPHHEGGLYFAEIFEQAFAPQWRIVLASTTAFALGSFFNIAVFSKIRERAGNAGKFKIAFVVAAFVSTLVAQFVDSTVFMVLAFAPIVTGVGSFGTGEYVPGLFGTFEMAWKDIWTSIGVGTVVQLIFETTIVAAIAVHLAKWLKVKKDKTAPQSEK